MRTDHRMSFQSQPCSGAGTQPLVDPSANSRDASNPGQLRNEAASPRRLSSSTFSTEQYQSPKHNQPQRELSSYPNKFRPTITVVRGQNSLPISSVSFHQTLFPKHCGVTFGHAADFYRYFLRVTASRSCKQLSSLSWNVAAVH